VRQATLISFAIVLCALILSPPQSDMTQKAGTRAWSE